MCISICASQTICLPGNKVDCINWRKSKRKFGIMIYHIYAAWWSLPSWWQHLLRDCKHLYCWKCSLAFLDRVQNYGSQTFGYQGSKITSLSPMQKTKTKTQIKIWIAILTPNFKEYNLTRNGKPSRSSERMVNNIFVHKIFLIFLVL